jgi:hypothetical protein
LLDRREKSIHVDMENATAHKELPYCVINAPLSTFVEWFPLRSNEPYCLI